MGSRTTPPRGSSFSVTAELLFAGFGLGGPLAPTRISAGAGASSFSPLLIRRRGDTHTCEATPGTGRRMTIRRSGGRGRADTGEGRGDRIGIAWRLSSSLRLGIDSEM